MQLLIEDWQQGDVLDSAAEILLYPPGPAFPLKLDWFSPILLHCWRQQACELNCGS